MPDGLRISADGRQLERSGFFTRRLYNEAHVETVNLEFDQSDYWQQLTNNFQSQTRIPARVIYRDDVLENAGVRFRGNTTYTSAGEKKSFDVDLEWQIDGQSINSYNSLKFQNGYEDPSSIRNVVYANLARQHIPAAKANFVNVVVNGRNFGIYTNLQKMNKDHVKEWFLDREATRWRAEAPGGGGGGFGGGFGGGGFGGGGGADCCFGGVFGAGTSSLNDRGPNGSDYEDAYELRHSIVDNPWQDLANVANTLGVVTPEFLVEQLGEYLDIDAALWFLATENIFTDDDGYVNKGGMDYYLYFDLHSERIVPIEYDGNTALNTQYATQWSPFYNASSNSLPLLTKLLAVPELRQRYLAHYRTIIEESLNPAVSHPLIDSYVSLIDPFMSAESVRDYSYSQFQSGVQDVKSFFTTRYQYLNNNSEVNTSSLSISDVQHSVNGQALARPAANESVQVSARVSGSGKGVQQVRLYYGTELMGRFERVNMNASGNGTYTADIPGFASETVVRYYIEAIADDSARTASFSPRGAEHNTWLYQVQGGNTVDSPVVINELQASNSSTATDSEGAYEDWIELYNNSGQAVDLSGWYLSDKADTLDQWSFPAGTVIQPNSTLIVWASNKADSLGGLHTNFALSADGEMTILVTPELRIADFAPFGESADDSSYARQPNGTGVLTRTSSPTFDSNN